jgi:hypothetical protein
VRCASSSPIRILASGTHERTMPPPLPDLIDDIIAEILLRIPPD